MSRLNVPQNRGVMDRESNSLTQVYFALIGAIVRKLNAIESIEALSGGNETAGASYDQTKQQALINKVNELVNSQK